MNTQNELTIKHHAEQLLQDDRSFVRQLAIEKLLNQGIKSCAALVDILRAVAELNDETKETVLHSEALERLFESAVFLDNRAKDEALNYARKEHELAQQALPLFAGIDEAKEH